MLPEPNNFALIIGGMKCGTTSLFELLAQHPQIAASQVKEPDFFVRADAPSRVDEYRELWDWDPGRHHIALEASTAYAKYPLVRDVPERIASTPGRFRFIYMVRDPIARIQSQVRHGLYGGWGKPLDVGLTQSLIDFSSYATQLDRYTAHFPRESILILTLEDLKRAPGVVLSRTCEFLDVDPSFEFANAQQPRNIGALYDTPPVIRWLAKSKLLKGLLDRLLTREMRHRLRSWVGRLEGEAPGRWRLTDSEIREVHDLLGEEMTRLQQEYSVEASWIPRAGQSSSPNQP